MDVDKIQLDVPPLEELSKSIAKGLVRDYAEATVEVVDCPDLRAEPFNLASEGLCGNVTVVEVSYRGLPTGPRKRLYNLREVVKAMDLNPCFLYGGGGSRWSCGKFAELYTNVRISNDDVYNCSKDIFIPDRRSEKISARDTPLNEIRFASLCASRGDPGKVIHIHCKTRITSLNFPDSILKYLQSSFDTPLALGMVFQLRNGVAKHHILPKIPTQFVKNVSELRDHFYYYHLPAPFTTVGTMVPTNPLNWSVETKHFHSFNGKNSGGHYNEDVTPDDAEYDGYMVPAETLCTIGRSKRPVCLFSNGIV